MESSVLPFTSLAEIAALHQAFMNGEIALQDFHHREHLAIAFFICLQNDKATAITRINEGLNKYLSRYGRQAEFHATMTGFWVVAVWQTLASNTSKALLEQANDILERFGNTGLIKQFYSRELLNSEAARKDCCRIYSHYRHYYKFARKKIAEGATLPIPPR
jgi:hypothetical protein